MSGGRVRDLLVAQLRVNLATAVRYRLDFLIAGGMTAFWMCWNLVPLLVLFNDRETVAGWDRPSALLLVAFFIILRGFLNAVVEPSLTDTVQKIRAGSFDYVLLKPIDSQLLASTGRFDVWRVFDMIGGLALAIYALAQRAQAPAPLDLALGVSLLLAGAMVMYALWLTAAALSFFVVRLDNLMYMLESIFDVARWPVQVFRGIWRLLFTIVVPVAIMTTYPAMAVLGTLSAQTALLAFAGAAAAVLASRALWRLAVGNYTSASS